MQDPPRSGIEPVSPASAGGFLTTREVLQIGFKFGYLGSSIMAAYIAVLNTHWFQWEKHTGQIVWLDRLLMSAVDMGSGRSNVPGYYFPVLVKPQKTSLMMLPCLR